MLEAGSCRSRDGLAEVFVGLLVVLHLALLAAVVEQLAPAAPQGDLGLRGGPAVDEAVHASIYIGHADLVNQAVF